MRLMTSALMAFAVALGADAAELGDPAAPLKIAEWVKGEPVELKEGNVYVVEFWATWCPPCRESIPHLTELQAKYKDVTFIGVSDEDAATVKPFVDKQGENMDYVVAVDDGGATSAAYMQAYGQSGIPTAFVVNRDGKVVWVGHPMADLGRVVGAVADGSFDLAAEQERMKRQKEVEEAMNTFQMALVNGEEAQAYATARKVMAEYDDMPMPLANMAWALLNFEGLEEPDYTLAGKLAEAALKAEKETIPALHHIYAKALYMQGQVEKAIAEQKKAIAIAEEQESEQAGMFKQALTEYENGGA